jgi:hypothetical protein
MPHVTSVRNERRDDLVEDALDLRAERLLDVRGDGLDQLGVAGDDVLGLVALPRLVAPDRRAGAAALDVVLATSRQLDGSAVRGVERAGEPRSSG